MNTLTRKRKGITSITSMTFLILAVILLITGLTAFNASLQQQTGATAQNTTGITSPAEQKMQEYQESLTENVQQLQPPSSQSSGIFMIVSNAWNSLVFMLTQFPAILGLMLDTTSTFLGVPAAVTGIIFVAIGAFVAYNILRVVFKTEP